MQNDVHMKRIYFLIGFLTLLMAVGFSCQTPSTTIPTAPHLVSVIEEPAAIESSMPASSFIVTTPSPTSSSPALAPSSGVASVATLEEPSPIANDVVIEVKNKGKAGFFYEPTSLQVIPGTKITILNNAKIMRDIEPKVLPQFHKFTVQPGKNIEPSNVGPRLSTGQSWSFAITKPGRYVVSNTLHAGSIIITVLEPALPSPSTDTVGITGNAVYLISSSNQPVPFFSFAAFIMVIGFAIASFRKR